MLLFIKNILARYFLIMESCGLCGRNVFNIWHTSDDLWKAVTGNNHLRGVRCVKCFDKEARARDILLRWTAERE